MTRVLMLLVPVAAVLLLGSLALRTSRPAAEDNFRDLRVACKAIPEDKNFRIVLEKAGASLPRGVSVSGWHELSLRSSLGLADPEAVRTALVQTAEARGILQSGIETCEGYSGRGGRAEFAHGLDPDCGALPRVWRISFEEALARGDVNAAYVHLCEGLKIVKLLLKTPSDFCDAGVLAAWFGQVVGACEKLVHQPGCRDEWLAELNGLIPRQESVARAGEQILKGQFWQCLNAVETGAAAKMVFPVAESSSSVSAGWSQRVHPRPTKRLLAEAFRRHVAALAACRADAAYFDLDPDVPGFALNLALNALRPNAGGRGVVDYYSLFTRMQVGRVKALESGASCLRAIIACERYRRACSGYPETLGALVPKYLDAVPGDAFDGGPMRYSRDRGILWSVGQNGADDGGATCTDKGEPGHYRNSQPNRALDMVFPVSSKAFEKAADQTRRLLDKKKR